LCYAECGIKWGKEQGEYNVKLQQRIRFPLMGLSVLTLLAAMWAGLLRLGWQLPVLRPTLSMAHGPLMVAGFMGTLISLERAVALERRWPYVAPALAALGSLFVLLGVFGPTGPVLMTLGSAGMVAIFGVIVRRHRALHTITMALGALTLLIGNALWLAGWPVYHIVMWWIAFLVLTIAGERLELSRVLRLSQATYRLFLGSVAVFISGLVLTLVNPDWGTRLTGIGLLAMAAWLLRYTKRISKFPVLRAKTYWKCHLKVEVSACG